MLRTHYCAHDVSIMEVLTEDEAYPNAFIYPKVLNITHQQDSTVIQALSPPSGNVGLGGSFFSA